MTHYHAGRLHEDYCGLDDHGHDGKCLTVTGEEAGRAEGTTMMWGKDADGYPIVVPAPPVVAEGEKLGEIGMAYNQGVEDCKAAIRLVGTDDWEGSQFKPYFITQIARTCSPHRFAARRPATEDADK